MTELELQIGVEREAPPALLRQLRVIDPTAELIYMGHGRWLLGRIAPSAPIRAAGERLAASCVRATAGRSMLRGRRWLSASDHHRYRFAQLRLHGFQPTTEYVVRGEPTAAIARDQEVMDYLHRTVTPGELDAMADEDELRRKATARAELRDDARARAAWRYMFTRSHSVTRFDGAGTSARARSGFTRHQVSA